ncbi:hypothetical protein DSO57_1023759 [Entomophthora muscae]|uniref:Uncharacterized protein n=1 Tax=Entomophthora muscae TaxID=34485 RepID=A0ACC2TQ79_9FUNG|nr:hypothetical protein DSO57_1023759 [Entomophthora muscae]
MNLITVLLCCSLQTLSSPTPYVGARTADSETWVGIRSHPWTPARRTMLSDWDSPTRSEILKRTDEGTIWTINHKITTDSKITQSSNHGLPFSVKN